jgi:hypothetical protein
VFEKLWLVLLRGAKRAAVGEKESDFGSVFVLKKYLMTAAKKKPERRFSENSSSSSSSSSKQQQQRAAAACCCCNTACNLYTYQPARLPSNADIHRKQQSTNPL